MTTRRYEIHECNGYWQIVDMTPGDQVVVWEFADARQAIETCRAMNQA